MKHCLFILLLAILFTSCKKDNKVHPSEDITVTRNFYFAAWDESGNQITTLNNNSFTINFYQNNSLIYSAKTKNLEILSGCCYHSFSINNFKDGKYLYEIKDSLNVFGYAHDSLISNNGYWGHSSTSLLNSWKQSISAGLCSVQRKPVFTILNYAIKDTTLSGGLFGIFLSANVSNNVNKGQLAIYVYKNNQVSYDNNFNFFPICPNSNCTSVSSSQPNTSTVISDFSLESTSGISLQPGDSVYFAIYPASYGYSNNCDPLGKWDAGGGGYPQYTAIGSQRILIPYKLH